MSKRDRNENDEINFVSEKLFENAINKAKRKHTFIKFFIGIISALIVICLIYLGASYKLKERIEDDSGAMLFSQIKGANVQWTSTINVYHFLNAVTYITVEKTIGDRNIIWNSIEIEVPAFGREKEINKGSMAKVTSSKLFNRKVRYNRYNGEREVQFYYPHVEYDYLPHELNLIKELDKNSLIEMALSFDKPYPLKDIENTLGSDNVNWLWVNTTFEEVVDKLSKPTKIPSLDKSLDGNSADGFQITGPGYETQGKLYLDNLKQLRKNGDYKVAATKILNGINKNSSPQVSDIKITGAVVTGTPEQLTRFQKLGIIRASTLGATISLY